MNVLLGLLAVARCHIVPWEKPGLATLPLRKNYNGVSLIRRGLPCLLASCVHLSHSNQIARATVNLVNLEFAESV